MISGRRSSSVDRMAILDMNDNPLVIIRVAPFHVFYAFSISDGHERFSMTATHIRTRTEFHFHGISWVLCRSIDRRSFEIFDADNTPVLAQSADRYLSTGSYELNIFKEHRELFAIAAAVCADVLNYADATLAVTV